MTDLCHCQIKGILDNRSAVPEPVIFDFDFVVEIPVLVAIHDLNNYDFRHCNFNH